MDKVGENARRAAVTGGEPTSGRTSSAAAERAICADRIIGRRPDLLDMEVIVRRQDHIRCASITSMIRHYVARRAKVIEDHPHNAEMRALPTHALMYRCA